jgi:hypothetical protein
VTDRRNHKTGHLNLNMRTTIWWEPRCPNVIKICTGDPRFVNDDGDKPGLWIPIRRCQRNRKNWNRLARALAKAGQLAPPMMP